jgi:hypothetical protein
MSNNFIPKKYIGVHPPGPGTNGNLDTIWIEQEDGSFKCDKRTFSISRAELESDVRNGFLRKVMN